MSLFNFLKSKKEEAHHDLCLPLIKRVETEQMASHCGNLRAVGREHEAKQQACRHLKKLGEICLIKKNWEWSSEMLCEIFCAASLLNEPALGKRIMDELITWHEQLAQKNFKEAPSIDLTQAYIHAGSLAHKMSDSRDEEYRCYWIAAETRPPAGCSQPASKKLKAMAHMMAYSLCSVEIHRDPYNHIEWAKRIAWHDAKQREFAPECDWDNDRAKLAWMMEEDSPV